MMRSLLYSTVSYAVIPYRNIHTKKSPARRRGISFNYLETRVQSYPNFPAVEAITKAA